ncbi:MAG: VTT domain-containing protein [Dehalococcoidia bacterium]|nr:VTT domain-containing protein [Dehalococcoidia bacterium]
MRKPTKREAIIGGIFLAVTISLSLFIIQHRGYIDKIAHWGYIGCFVINVLASGTFMIFPGFGLVLTFTLGGVLNPAIVGAVAGIGEAIGAVGAYFTGYAGKGLFRDSNSGLYLRFSNIIDRHGSKAIFFVSAVLSPIFYPFAVLSGMLRFGWVRFFFATWAGRTVKNMALAYLGYFGLHSLLEWLGVGI